MAKDRSFIHEFFENSSNNIYEFITVLDMDVENKPNYIIALFKKVNSNYVDEILLPPELLRKTYKVGHFYKKGKRVYNNKEIHKDLISIETNTMDEVYTMASIFQGKNVLDGLGDYYNKFFQKQWAYKIETENSVLVIPCYAIMSRFYFMSSSMKNAVMESSFNSLVYEFSPIRDDEAKLHIKHKAGKKDLPFICRFHYNKDAWERFKYFFIQASASKYQYTSVKSYFPINEAFDISISYKVLDYRINNKPVHYVVSINNDTSSLGFSKLIYRQYSSTQKPDDVELKKLKLPKGRNYKKRRPYKKDHIIRLGTPSSENINEMMFEETEKDLNTVGLIVKGENIYMPSEGQLDLENKDEKGSGSFEPQSLDGDEKLSPLGYAERNKDDKTEIFKLEDFFKFYESLMQMHGVQEIEELSLCKVPMVKNSKKNGYSSISINSKKGENRKYLFSVFGYDNKDVYIVEFEHDTWTPSTWFFVSDEVCEEYYIDTFDKIIYLYIKEKMNYNELSEHALNLYGLTFVNHNHKKGDVDDVAIDSWCDNLLDKII